MNKGVQSAGSEAGKASTRKQQRHAAAGSSVEGTVETPLRVGQRGSLGGECGGEVDRARRLRLAQPAGAQQSGMAAAAQGGRRANNQGKNRANSRPGACAQPPRAAAPPHARPGSSSSKETAPALAAVRCAMPQPPVARPPCRRPQRPPAPPGGPCSCRGWGESRMAGTRVGKEVTWSIPPKGLANDCAPQPCR